MAPHRAALRGEKNVRSVRVLTVAAAVASAALLAGCGDGTTTGAAGTTSPAAAPVSSAAPRPAGNGIAALPAPEVIRQAKQAFTDARTLRVLANLSDGGQPLRLDLHIAGSRGGIGTITTNGATFQLLRIGNEAYIKAAEPAWRKLGAGDGASLLVGKWVKVPTNDKDFADVIAFTDISSLGKMIFDGSDVGVPDVGQVKFRGADAVRLTDPDGGGTIFISAATGPAYPLRLQVLAPKSDAGTIDFLEFNRPFALGRPPAEQVVDTTK
jgi:hypothetical protein